MRFTSTLMLAISALTSLVAAATTTSSGENPITYPLGGSIKAGSDVTITWTVTSGTSCDLILRKGEDTDLDEVLNIATGIPNTGAFTWSVPSKTPAGKDYSIQIAAGDKDNYSPMFNIESDVTSSSSSVSTSSTSTSSKSSTSTTSSTTLITSTTASTTVSASATATTANASSTVIGSSNSSVILSTTHAASSATPEATVVAANVNSGAQLASPLALVMCIFAGLMYLN